jgi:FkbM family methyltransferase
MALPQNKVWLVDPTKFAEPVSAVTSIKQFLWTATRVGRRWGMTCIGRNPLVRGSAAPGWSFEWRAVEGLLRSSAQAPVKRRQDSTAQLWSTSLGDFWIPPDADAEFVRILAAEMEAGVYDMSGVRPRGGAGPVVIDCGANVGFFSRWALLQGAAKVICFEPSPGNIACLRRNLADDIAAGRVIVIEKGVWDQEAVLSFSAKNLVNPGGHHIVEDDSGELRVNVTTIDCVCGELGIETVDFVKMDVEGAEQRALAGAADLIRRAHPNLCVVTEHTDDLFINAKRVIDIVGQIDPRYRHRFTEAHPYQSPSRGNVLTPYSTLFY